VDFTILHQNRISTSNNDFWNLKNYPGH
jgi:hypothetical protein